MPIHLYGGALLPGQDLGNRIGAVTLSVDASGDSAVASLSRAREALAMVKETPAAIVSHLVAKVVSLPVVPTFLARCAMERGTCGATFAVSNVRGPPKYLHVAGRRVERVCGFVPPPPGVPIGVVVGSYGGKVTITVNADARCVEDGEKFLGWVLEEVRALAEEQKLLKKGV